MDGTLALKKYDILRRIEALEEGGGGSTTSEYSTEEKEIGKWIDGSTLYQKTYVLREDGVDKFPYVSATQQFQTGDSYGIVMVDSMIAIRNNGKTFEAFNYGNSATVLFVDKTDGIFFVIKDNFTTLIVTLRYTKPSEAKKRSKKEK